MQPDREPIDKRLADLLGPAGARALRQLCGQLGLEYRFVRALTNGRSLSLVVIVFERHRQGAQKIIFKVDPPTERGLERSEYARHRAAVEDPEAQDFAREHIVPPYERDPLHLGEGGWLVMQDVAGHGFDDMTVLTGLLAGVPGARIPGVLKPVGCDRDSFARICTTIVEGVLADWARAPDIETMTVAAFLDRHIEERFAPGTGLHKIGADWPEHEIWLEGESSARPNPFHLLTGEHPAAAAELTALVGRAHGDLHTENILVHTVAAESAVFPYFLIDFARYDPRAPLTRDPVYLLVSIINRSMGEFSDSQREALLEVLLDDASPRAQLLPSWLSTLISRVQGAGREWSARSNLVDEWKALTPLSILAVALILAGRASTEDRFRMWYLRLAARAADRFLGTPREEEPLAAGTTAAAHRISAIADTDVVTAQLCVDIPGLRREAFGTSYQRTVEELIAKARLGQDVSGAYADLRRSLNHPDEVRHALPALRGGRPVVGEVFTCPFARACARVDRRSGGAEPVCHLTGGPMTQVSR